MTLALGLCLGVSGGTALASAGEAEAAARPVITITNFAFQGDLTVLAGKKVTVRNADAVPHTLTAVDGSFDTKVIPPGGTATFRAPKTSGNYAITCTIHPRMSGTLTVGVKPPKNPVITIKAFAYEGDLTVRPGAKVTVRNEDRAPHTLTAVDGSFGTIIIPPGGTATFRAPKKLGTYQITCTVHPRMSGTLTVAKVVTPKPTPPSRLVIIKDFTFQGELTVPPGAYLLVRNDDLATHDLTADDGSFHTPPILGGNDESIFGPTTPGAYPIHCSFHPSMTATLTVTDHHQHHH